ncbi:Gfo/Idh/MocA family protein [Catenuloplanes japonicus]|uniref:Gfo/Idh/MocA family protein n=1 Tax=Catenuloplanes japonicus TaxID=33876 RepID=UPI000526513F|nr:Gfo/Idh/MocA family oxidoreductase [Catenuloplanes japonicus]
MSTLRVGVVGLGAISRYYLAALETVPGVRLAAVCDTDPARLRAGSAAGVAGSSRTAGIPRLPAVPSWPDVRGFDSHTALALAGGVDAVVVTTPNDTHAAICADLLDAGLPVCVEKPLALRPAEGDALARRAEQRGVVLFTAFHRRYNDAVLALRAGLPAGVPIRELTVRYWERIEEHIGGDAWYLDAARCGGGCVADNGPNAFDLVRLFAGDPAGTRVTGVDVRRDADGCDRQATVTLRAGTLDARVELDWSYPGEVKDVEVTLADGTRRRADMLAGHAGFKASLWHEYEALVAAFAARVRTGPAPDGGPAALDLVDEVYRMEGCVMT